MTRRPRRRLDGRVSDAAGEGCERRDRGSATVATLVFLFAFTSVGVILLSRDVNRAVSNRSAAQSIAFQAARAGAQQVDLDSLRGDGRAVAIDVAAAEAAGEAHGQALIREYGLTGVVEITTSGDRVTATVELADDIDRVFSGVEDPTATATVQAQSGP